jgi:hypothetical protein
MKASMNKEIHKVVKSLKANNFKPVEYVEKAEDTIEMILDMIPEDASLEMAGSISVNQLGLMNRLIERGNKGPDFSELGKVSMADMVRTRKDVLLASTNAVTLDGKLVNTDMMGNRVSAMILGPKKVILLIGRNKIVRDLDEALHRVKHVIAPYHAKTMGMKTPCSKTGKCEDCSSPQRICNVTTIISKKPPGVEFAIILVGEDLGLGWDPNWPKKRIEKIASAYRSEMEKMNALFTRSKT